MNGLWGPRGGWVRYRDDSCGQLEVVLPCNHEHIYTFMQHPVCARVMWVIHLLSQRQTTGAPRGFGYDIATCILDHMFFQGTIASRCRTNVDNLQNALARGGYIAYGTHENRVIEPITINLIRSIPPVIMFAGTLPGYIEAATIHCSDDDGGLLLSYLFNCRIITDRSEIRGPMFIAETHCTLPNIYEMGTPNYAESLSYLMTPEEIIGRISIPRYFPPDRWLRD